VKNVHSEPSGRRFDGKCRSSKQTSDPSSAAASTAPQTVTARTPVAPSDFSAAMFARCATWFESRGWPGPWREMCITSTPSHVPRDMSTSPHGVYTGSGPELSSPGSA